MTAPDADDNIRILESPGRYAVLLNALAKGWSGELHHEIQRIVPSDDLYLTDDFRQAEHTIDTLLARDYDLIFTGGGDGTIMFLVNALEARIRSGQIDRDEAPPVGVLRMGSGNAIATYLGAHSATDKLEALQAGAPVAVHKLNMLESHGEMFPFAGIGWDADILNDYEDFKEAVRDTALEPYATGFSGYLAAICTRTFPRVLHTDPVEVEITNRGEHAVAVDQKGSVLEEYDSGDILFSGPVQTAAAASVSYWGYRIRMFPHATKEWGYSMLRCFDGSPASILRHLPSFWRGRFPEGHVYNFLFQRVRIETRGRAMPYQTTGEAAGMERVLDWRVADHPVHLAAPIS
jgi:diacylglycerol kinase family enzyme